MLEDFFLYFISKQLHTYGKKIKMFLFKLIKHNLASPHKTWGDINNSQQQQQSRNETV